MKKTLLIVIALLGLSLAAVAQPKAIGVRGGLFGPHFNGEISYEHWATLFDNDYDFAEIDLGVFGGNGFKATALYNAASGASMPVPAWPSATVRATSSRKTEPRSRRLVRSWASPPSWAWSTPSGSRCSCPSISVPAS